MLIEEFIEGPEFTVLISSNYQNPSCPIVFPPLQETFPEGETFKHFNLKWVDFEGLGWFKV